MSVTPSTIIYINSKNRTSGNPWDFYLNFNDNLIKAPKDHYIQLSVQQVSINRSWYSIQTGYNTFNVTDTSGGNQTITIPVGYYNATDLRSTLQALLPSWTITYDKKINKYSFTRPTNGIVSYSFVIPSSVIGDLLGFNTTETPSFTSIAPTVISSKPIKVNADTSIYIHTNIPRQKLSAIDNINPTLSESDVLCSIAIQSAPFDNVVFAHNNGADFLYNVLAPSIHQMRIYVTNEQGTPLQLAYDWDMTLSITYIPISDNTNKMTKILNDIKDYIKLGLLHNLDDRPNNNI